jgi:hypothetical protein
VTGARARVGVLLLACALPLLGPSPAAATFTTRALGATTASTATVAPPTGLSTAGSTTCVLGLTTSYTVRVTWTASPTARVSAYRVTETVGGVPRAPVDVATTSFSRVASKALIGSVTHSIAVQARTDYGWTSTAATVGYTC